MRGGSSSIGETQISTDVVIEGLGATGDGVGRLEDGRVVFVEGALPGDRVRVVPRERRKRVQYADLVEIITPSAERVASRCRVERCGGCALKALSGTGQSEVKRSRVVETMRRLGHLDVEALLGPVRQFGDGWGYRHRVRMHAVWNRQRWDIGYFERRSRSIVPFAVCPVLLPQLEATCARVTKGLADLPRHARLEDVEVAYSLRDQRAVAKVTGLGPITPFRRLAERLGEMGISGIDVETPSGRWRHGNVELRYDHQREQQFDLAFEAGVFTQAFPLANDRLVDAVIGAVRPREAPRVLELHAGIGNFSLPLCRAGAVVTAVEQNRRAAILCRRNAQRAGLRIDVRDISDQEALSDGDLHTYDVLLMDPPRTGALEVVRKIAASAGASADTSGEMPSSRVPGRVVYVSCDPATLARDCAVLAEVGYRVVHMEAYDMFPQTPHVESLVVLDRLIS